MTNELSVGGNVGKASAPLVNLFSVDSLKERPVSIDILANAQQCAGLAELNGLVAVRDFSAHFDIARSGRTGAKVTGEIVAHVVQTCVVTLEPFDSEVRERVEVKFSPEAPELPAAGRHRRGEHLREMADVAVEHHIDEEDPPDPIVGGKIDLGALAAEFFALGLDPYPRKPGADLSEVAKGIPNLELDAAAAEPEKISPFAALAKLKNNSKSDV